MKENFLIIKTDTANSPQPEVSLVNGNTIRVYFNHRTEQSEGTDGEVVTMYVADFIEAPYTGEKDAVVLAKEAVINAIVEFDKSEEVNSFSIQGNATWLDAEKRTQLKRRFEVEVQRGITSTHLIIEEAGVAVEIAPQNGLAMLDELEYYAIQTYDKTQAHKAAVVGLSTVKDVVDYNFTAGYPEKLSF